MVTVGTDEICAAIKDVFEDTRSILEPAGALAIAGLKADVARRNLRDKTLIAGLRRRHEFRSPALRGGTSGAG